MKMSKAEQLSHDVEQRKAFNRRMAEVGMPHRLPIGLLGVDLSPFKHKQDGFIALWLAGNVVVCDEVADG